MLKAVSGRTHSSQGLIPFDVIIYFAICFQTFGRLGLSSGGIANILQRSGHAKYGSQQPGRQFQLSQPAAQNAYVALTTNSAWTRSTSQAKQIRSSKQNSGNFAEATLQLKSGQTLQNTKLGQLCNLARTFDCQNENEIPRLKQMKSHLPRKTRKEVQAVMGLVSCFLRFSWFKVFVFAGNFAAPTLQLKSGLTLQNTEVCQLCNLARQFEFEIQ